MAEKGFILLAVSLAFILFTGPANGDITVHSGDRIQKAIDSAAPGEIILVSSGSYNESLVVDKSLVLRGIDTGGGQPQVQSDEGPAIILLAKGVTIEGFAIKSQSSRRESAGILIQSNDNLIIDNLVHGCGNAGVVLSHAINNTILSNLIEGNGNEGMYLKNSSRNRLEGNRIRDNRYGLRLEDSHTNEIVGNLLQNNQFEAMYLQASHSNLIEGNLAEDNEVGLVMEKSRSNLVARNDIQGNEKGISLTSQESSIAVSTKGVFISYNATPSGAITPSNNTIYLNNLSNEANAYDDGLNRWDDGLIGNNYSDFNDPEEGCRGRTICATSYSIPGGPSIDEHPQASPIREPGLVSGMGGAFMQLSGTSFLPGGEMRLNYTTPAGIDAWLGLQSIALDEENLAQDLYLGENISGDILLTAPYMEGSFKLVMHDSNATAVISLPFNVSFPQISASPSSVLTCEKITVSFQGERGGEKDWIGMYRSESSNALSSQSLARRESGAVTFTAEEAGSYVFKLFATGESIPLASSNAVEVKADSGHKMVAEPSQVAAGGTVTVTYWGAAPASVIGMYGLTSPDKFDSGKRSTGGKSCGSMVWQLPSKPGQYDFRLFGDDVNRPILAYSNVVTVG
ncbi:right-handed parallel beta-helix repeat-containing protein [Methanothrix soehngenii]|jgi:parallel beta-helix repeat protein|uniref:right-handed parallel beta-helix repeat-containing protein n=1 Tax=Methanothrix soehngenii TaxID=2223 RepID=UPI003141E59F